MNTSISKDFDTYGNHGWYNILDNNSVAPHTTTKNDIIRRKNQS
jgi:hypothetical protein